MVRKTAFNCKRFGEFSAGCRLQVAG